MSPPMLNTPSTTTSAPRPLQLCSVCSRWAMSLWRKRFISPIERRQPSTMLAWSSRSVMTTSSRPTRAEMVPRFTCMPVLNTSPASLPTKSAKSCSSWLCQARLPLRKREPVQLVP